MKRDYIPEGRTTTPAEIAAHNLYLDALCARIVPSARAAFEKANKKAFEAVKPLLYEDMPEEIKEFLISQGLDEEDIIALNLHNEAETSADFADFAERRGKDLARAVAGFWVNLGEDEKSRREAGAQVVKDLADGNTSKAAKNFDLIASRFWIGGRDASKVLNILNTPQPGS